MELEFETAKAPPAFDPSEFEAVLLDLDGVLTDTASLHRRAWKAMFDEFLSRDARARGVEFVPFDANDYLAFVDGRSRLDGVASFLASRHITVPDPSASQAGDSMERLGDRKNEIFLSLLESEGATLLPGARPFVEWVSRQGLGTAVVSSSRNARTVLKAAHIVDAFDVIVDGLVAGELGLAAKPDPGTFLHAARRLHVAPAAAVVVEDAQAGVAAGRAGGFRLVVGIGGPDAAPGLLSQGADLVVPSLEHLLPD